MREQISDHIRTTDAAIRQIPILEEISRRVIACFQADGRVYLLGNGGSAADAQHIAAELIGRFKKNRKPLPAIALTTDTSNLTAVANDFGFEQVFERQILALVTAKDIVWALSVSGTSPNVIRGLDAARRSGATIVGFTGRGPNDLSRIADLCFQVDHTSSDRVQEIHQLGYHLVCDAVESHFAKQS